MPAPLHRNHSHACRHASLALVTALCVSGPACRNAPDEEGKVETTAASADDGARQAVVDEGPLPELRTGTLEPEKHAKVESTARHRHAVTGPRPAQYLEFDVEVGDAPTDPPRVAIDGLPGTYAVGFNEETHTTVVLRHPGKDPLPKTIEGHVLVPRGWGSQRRWHEYPFVVTSAGASADTELADRFASHFPFAGDRVDFFGSRRGHHPWAAFARARMRAMQAERADGELDQLINDPLGRGAGNDLSRLMETTSAAISLQEALQHKRGLQMRRGDEARSFDIASVQAPPLAAHPFEAMRKQLAKPDAGHKEELAAATPHDFWYLRFSDVRLLLRTLDEADAWLTPVVQILQANSEHRDLTLRYQGQLALRRSDLARALGNTVIDAIAMVGSDPYLREGSDLTVIFKAKNMAILKAELDRQRQSWEAQVSGVEASTFAVRGHTVAVWADPTGAVHRHQAEVGDLLVVSNSKAAITRVLDTLDGQHPSLATQPELAFMLARDASTEPPDAFAFLSDAFIAAVISPQQKVQQARRQLAYADLLVPGYAALLHGWLEGQSPQDLAALTARGYLGPNDLRHDDGAEIRFAPGVAARSKWGTVESLTPLIDMPPVAKVSEREKLAYEAFARGYQNNWTTFIDPVAMRLDVEDSGKRTQATVQVRVLPLIQNSEYDQILDVVAEQRIAVPEVDDGVALVWAVGKDTPLRREFNQLARSFTGDGKIGLDWLGTWVSVGALDRNAILEAAWYELDDVQLPEPKPAAGEDRDLVLARRVGQLPLFAMAETSNPAGVAATLTGLKGMATSAAPGMLAWGEDYQHRDVPVVRVAASATSSDPKVKSFADAISLYYANAGGVLIFALRKDVLNLLIDRALDAKLPKGLADDTREGAQFVVTGHSDPGRPLWTALAWSLQAQANDVQALPRQAAEILLRGAPETRGKPELFVQMARAYFGSVPTTATGTHDWELEGAGVSDPVHGSAWAPKFVALPVPGSPIAALMERLSGLRGEVGFEREPGSGDPPGRSLVTRFELSLGERP